MLLKEPEPAPVVLDAQIESIRVLPDTLRRVTPEAAPNSLRRSLRTPVVALRI